MSCAVCYGYPGCPCCSPEPQTVTCPACKGTGEIYYNSDGERITKEEYDKLPADQRNVIVVLNVMEAEKSNMMMNRIGTRCPADMITIKNQEQYDTKA